MLAVVLAFADSGPLVGAIVQDAAAGDPEQPAGRSVRLSLETDLPEEISAAVSDPLRLPAERTAEFYGNTLGGVLAHMHQPEHPQAFLAWIGEQAPDAITREPVDPEQLRQDAARLARVRLRKTEDERAAGRQPFVAFRDLLARPEFYATRPFTIWGHARTVRPVTAQGASEPVLYEVSVEPFEQPGRTALVLLPHLPDAFPTAGDIREAVTVTGYLFRGMPPDEDGMEPGRLTPLLVAPSLTWHQPELRPEVRQSLVASIQHRTPHRREEVDDFYRVLRHAQLVDYDHQQAAAARFRRERIEQLPRDSRADLQHRLRQVAEARRANPRDAEAHERREAQAKSIYRQEQRLAAARDTPEQFPWFAHVFRSAESSDPHRYTGRLVTFRGHIRKHVSYPADPENEYGVTWLHEVWLYPDDGDSNPVVVVCTSAPDGLPLGEDLLETGSVTGYFYKLWAYPARDTNRVAPMVLAQRVEWQPGVEAGGWPDWVPVAVWSIGGLAALGLLWSAWRLTGRRRRLPERHASATGDEPPDFSGLET